MPNELKTGNKNLNILSLNAQSINAKFDNLQILIKALEEQDIKLHAICIQESWLNKDSNLDLFQLDGYRCFAQGKRCSPHGGLITYVDTNLNATSLCNPLTSTTNSFLRCESWDQCTKTTSYDILIFFTVFLLIIVDFSSMAP